MQHEHAHSHARGFTSRHFYSAGDDYRQCAWQYIDGNGTPYGCDKGGRLCDSESENQEDCKCVVRCKYQLGFEAECPYQKAENEEECETCAVIKSSGMHVLQTACVYASRSR